MKRLILISMLVMASCGTLVPNYTINGKVKEVGEGTIMLYSGDTLHSTYPRLIRAIDLDNTYRFKFRCHKVVDLILIKE